MGQNFLKAQIQLCQDMVSTQSRHGHDQRYDMYAEEMAEDQSDTSQRNDLVVVRDLSDKLAMIKADLNTKLDAGIKESRELQGRKESFQTRIEQKIQLIHDIEKTIHNLIANDQQVIEEMEKTLSRECSDLKIEKEAFSKREEELNQEKEQLVLELAQLCDTLDNCQAKFEEQTARQEKESGLLRQNQDKTEAELEALRRENDATRKRKSAEIETATQRISEIMAEISQCDETLELEKESLIEIESEAYLANIDRINESIERFTEDVSAMQAEIDNVTDKIGKCVEDKKVLEEEHKDYVSRQNQLIEDIKQSIDEAKSKCSFPVEKMNENKAQLVEHLKELKIILEDKDDEVRLFNKKLVSLFSTDQKELGLSDAELDTAIEEMTQQTDEIKQERASVRADVALHQNRIDLIEKNLAKADEEIQESLSEESERFSKAENDLKNEEDQFLEKLSVLMKAEEEFKENKNRHVQDLEALKGSSEELFSKKEKMAIERQEEVDAINAKTKMAINNLMHRIETVSKERAELETKISLEKQVLEQFEKTASERLADLEQELGETTTKQKEMREKMEADFEDFVAVEEGHKKRKIVLENNLTEIENRIDQELDHIKTGLEARTEKLKEDEASYQEMVNELDQRLNEQERRKEGAMAEKENLEKQLQQNLKEFGELQKQLLSSFSSGIEQISN